MTNEELDRALRNRPSPNFIGPDYITGRIEHVSYERIGGGTLTICFITVDNGFQVIGKSACADPDNYNKETGQKIAYDNAFRELWPLFGFLLKEKMYLVNKGE